MIPQRVWHLCVVPTVDVKNPDVGGWGSLTVGLDLPAEDGNTGVWRCNCTCGERGRRKGRVIKNMKREVQQKGSTHCMQKRTKTVLHK